MKPEITKIKSFDDLFELPKETVLDAGDRRWVGIWDTPKKKDPYIEWKIIEDISPDELAVHQVRPEHIRTTKNGEIILSVPWYYSSRYKQDGGRLHECYQEFKDFLIKIGISK